jgi:Ca-activated chloride channel family protein
MFFASPGFLWLLLVVGAMAFYNHRWKSRGETSIGFSSLSHLKSLGDRRAAAWENIRGWIRLAMLALFVIALARPQQGLKGDDRFMQATDIMLCLDASDSMRSEDFKPKNRITVAKEAAKEFAEKRRDDRLGLVVFGEMALTLCPLTTDRGALAGLLQSVEVGEVPQNRTAIGDALATAIERLKASGAKSKVIILLTDGNNNAGTLDPLTAAKAATGFGIRIYTIGAGSAEGGLLPVDDPYFGRRYVRTNDKLDEEVLTKIAESTGGKYFRATNAKGLRTVFDGINRMEKTEVRVTSYTEFIERFEWWLLPALALLGLEMAAGAVLFRGLP